jgi:copper chaperone CopZ
VTGAEKAVAGVKGVTASVDQDAETVSLTGPDSATVQKAADALVAAGYFGKSGDAGVKLAADTGAKGKKVQTLKLEGVHLCCGKCVSAVDKAVKSVSGVKEHTAKKDAKTFEVTGDFNDQEVVDALHKAGLTGKVAK